MHQREQEATGPSRPTQTITSTPSPQPPPTIQAGTLRLRGHHIDTRRVAWTQNTIDNEKLGRKSSKICCIYHKPKNFDESSSESSSSSDSDDTGDEHDSVARRDLKRKIQEKKKAKRQKQEIGAGGHSGSHGAGQGDCCDHEVEHGHSNSSAEEKVETSSATHNAYEKGVR